MQSMASVQQRVLDSSKASGKAKAKDEEPMFLEGLGFGPQRLFSVSGRFCSDNERLRLLQVTDRRHQGVNELRNSPFVISLKSFTSTIYLHM